MSAAPDGDPPHPFHGWANSPARYLLLSLYWLPISLFWGMMLGQILPPRVEDFSGTAHEGGFLAIISVVGATASAVIQLVIGPISDHFRSRLGRRRPFLLVGTLVAIAAMIGFGLAQSFVELTICYFLVQLFLNVANGPYVAYMPDLVSRERHGTASAFMGLMQLLGKAGGPLVAGLAVAHAMAPYVNLGADPVAVHAASIARLHVFQQLLALDAAIFLICLVVTAAALPDPPSVSATSSAQAVRSMFRWDVVANGNFFRLLLSRGVYNAGFYVALLYLPYYVQDSLGLGLGYADALKNLQIFTIGGALLGTFPAGILADRTSKKRVVYVSCAFSAAATIAFGLTHAVGTAYVMAVAFGIGYGAFCAVDWAFACNLLPVGSPAKFMAIWSLSDTIPQILAPAFGPVADLLNRGLGQGAGWRAAMIVAGACVLLGAAVIRGVRENIALAARSPDKSGALEQM
jgi:MFS family permease